MAFPANRQRPGVHFSVIKSGKNQSSDATGTTSTSTTRVYLYVMKDGTLCAKGPAFAIDGETVKFSRAIRSKLQEETLIIKNQKV